MASVLLRPARPLPTSRPTSAAPRLRWRSAAWLLSSLPLIVLAYWAYRQGYSQRGLAFIEHRAALTAAGGIQLSGLKYAYPPLPVLLAVILPGGQLGLAVFTCLSSGAALTYTGVRLTRRLPVTVVAMLLLPLVAVPVMWYAASQLLTTVIGLTFLAVALDGFIRFAAYGETDGGFTAGIALGLSYCADPGALLYGTVMVLFAPLISHIRYQDDRLATASIGAVLFFPIMAVAASWAFLVWRFSGTFPGSLHYSPAAHVLAFPSGVWPGLGHAALTGLTDLAHVPLYLLAGWALFRRRPVAALGLALPVVALVAALWLGFAYSAVTAYFMFTLLSLSMITHSRRARRSARLRWLLAGAAVAQLALAIWWAPTSPGFIAWWHAMIG
jgi:hypothetical protein